MISNPFVEEVAHVRPAVVNRWVDGTVTSVDPLLVRLDGYLETPQAPTKPPLIGGLVVGDRVMCLLYGRQLVVVGAYGGKDGGGGGGVLPDPIVYNPKDFGATGNGVTNDWVGVQAAFTACKANGGTVFIPAGVYRLGSELNVYSNTTVYATGATLKRAHNGYLVIVGERGSNYTGYTGNTDITWLGGVLDHNGDEFSGTGSTWTMSHCRNITLERVLFLDATSHAIECNATYNGRFLGCDFSGYRNDGGNSFVEAIQLDIAMSGGFSAYGAYDGTYSEQILIDGCTFRSSANYPPHPRGVGSHGGRIDAASRAVTIRSNRFINLASYAIRIYNWHGTSVADNYCTGGPFLLANTPIVGDGTSDNTKLVNGTQTGSSVSIGGIYIRNNEHRGEGPSVYLKGEPTGQILDVALEGNRFDNGYAGDHTIRVSDVDGLTIDGGKIYRAGIGGIGIESVKNMTVNGLVIDGANRNGILIQNFNSVTLNGCVTKNCSVSSPANYYHVRVSGGGSQCTVSGHVASTAGGAGTPAAGFSATSAVTRITRVGCDWGGYGVSDSSPSPLVAAERS